MRSVKAQPKPRRSTQPKPKRRAQSSARAPVERIVLGHSAPGRDGVFARSANLLLRLLFPKRPMLVLTCVLVVASVIAALIAGGYVSGAFKAGGRKVDSAVAGTGFGITSITLAGNARTRPSDILAALGMQTGQSIFGVDIEAARAHLLALPWVADAQVRRQFPDTLCISIVEKLPFALWQTDNDLFVVERAGGVITRARSADYPHLPLFVGDGAPEAGAELVDAIAAHRAIASRVKAMQRVSERRWNLVLDDGVLIDLPEAGWDKQLDVLDHLIVDKGVLERDISEIDLRSPENYYFELRNKQPTTRGNAT